MPPRPSKRSKNEAKATAAVVKAPAGPLPQSRLFAPFRALGFVSDDVPFSMFVHTPKGALAKPTIHIVSSIGRSWLMWDAERMTLLFAGPDAGAPINSIAQTGTEVFAAAGPRVIKYLRGKETAVYDAPDGSTVGKILIFGEQLVALKHDGTGLFVWNIASTELDNEIQFHSTFTATTLMHPVTYLNKILVGSKEGELALWNIRTGSLIHTFPSFTPSAPSPVTTIVQSPAVDVVGVGYLDGAIRVMDIKDAELVMQMRMDQGSIEGLSFRMDGPPILASSSSAGTIAIWDLNKGGRVLHTTRMAHEQSVTGLEWVQGQPLLISSSPDNSVKQWAFDAPTNAPRLLKFRTGHHAPPSTIRYYGEDGKQILTTGRDRALRYTSVVRDSRSHELSQGSLIKKAIGLGVSADELKFPPIIALSSSSTRSKDWEDVLTAHAEDSTARTWRVQDKRLGQAEFDMEEDGAVQAVCVTACGNFGLAGSSTGEIRMWNMQSGKERKSFALSGPAPGDSKPKIIQQSKPKKSKTKTVQKTIEAVVGLATDALNTTVIAGTLEGKLYFFDFHTTQLLHTVQLDSSITAIDLNRDSGLLAVVCDDLVVRLVDIETRRVVRELRGFRGRILDTTFTPDSRWLIATSLDSVIRTFDIPSGKLVDAFRSSSIATSVTFSPTGDFLATAHVDSLGVHLWANKAQFSDVALRHIPEDEDVPEVALPTVQGVDDEALEGLEPVGAPEYTDIYTTPDFLAEGLLTLSLLPRSRWQTLLNLETIKARNKPKEPVKAPEAAPFFLPTVAGLEPRFDVTAAQAGSEDPFSARLAPSASFLESEFTRRLAREDEDGDYAAFFEYMKALSPSAVDLEIRSLVSLDHLAAFLAALVGRLRSHRDFEAVQAFMTVFLSVHGDVLIANAELRDLLVRLQAEQKKESNRLLELISYSMGTISFLRG
ncbi:rRNA-processing protein utp21 [Vanrija albida]|uniref:rRNA-processing protein utp21 n=1 Tax=Vanrija albida TaxID=181172 RepID=A0ABR3QER4_9TREE